MRKWDKHSLLPILNLDPKGTWDKNGFRIVFLIFNFFFKFFIQRCHFTKKIDLISILIVKYDESGFTKSSRRQMFVCLLHNTMFF